MKVTIGLVGLSITAMLVFAPGVLADGEDVPTCGTHPREAEADWGSYYVNLVDDQPADIGIWKETNMLSGLQTAPWTCENPVTGTIHDYNADTQTAR